MTSPPLPPGAPGEPGPGEPSAVAGPAPAAPPTPPARRRRQGLAELATTPASLALVAVQVAVLTWVTLSLGDPTDARVLVRAGALERGMVQAGQWWRLLAAPFLHVGWFHLALNATFGLSWCRLVERLAGPARLVALFVVSGLGASAASLLAHDVVSAGASGAIFGMIGVTLALHQRSLPGWRAFARSRTTLLVGAQIAIWTAVALVFDLPIDHAAHLGGLVTGAASTWALTSRAHRRWRLAAVGAVLVAASAAACWPRPGLSRFTGQHLEQLAFEALRRDDARAAAEALGRLERAGWHSPESDYAAGAVALELHQVEAAAEAARRLLGDPTHPDLHGPAANLLYAAGATAFNGDGVPRDPALGFRLVVEACAAGHEAACRAERQIKTGVREEPQAEPEGAPTHAP